MDIKQLIIEVGSIVILTFMIILVFSQMNYNADEDTPLNDTDSDSLSLSGAMSGTIG